MTYRWPAFAAAVLVAVLALPIAFVLLLAPASEGACGLSSPPALHGSERDAGGGVFVGGKWHYPEQGGPTWTPAQIAAKAEQYDLPGETFAQIAHGESDYHPYVVQHDPGDGNVGFGFFQFTPNAWGPPGNATQRKLDELGGQHGLEDIEKQFQLARFMYRSAGGISPWHGTQYVTDFTPPAATGPIADALAATNCGGDLAGGTELAAGGSWLAPLPGFPGRQCDARIIPDVETLVRRYHVAVGDCYSAADVHASAGEHPLGLATDLVPGPGGTWDDVDRLARDIGWVRSCGASGVRPACPLTPWVRFAGYDGYPNHGRGNHLHISWMHGPGRPASTVTVFTGGSK